MVSFLKLRVTESQNIKKKDVQSPMYNDLVPNKGRRI